MVALGIFSAVKSETLYLTNFTINFWACCTDYLIFKIGWMLLIMIAVFQIAVTLSIGCSALGCGINPFIVLVIQTILIVIAVNQRGFWLSKSFSFGSCFSVLGWNFPLRITYMFYTTKGRKKRQSSQLKQVKEQSSHFSILSAMASGFIPAGPDVTLIKNTKEGRWCLYVFLHMEILFRSEL